MGLLPAAGMRAFTRIGKTNRLWAGVLLLGLVCYPGRTVAQAPSAQQEPPAPDRGVRVSSAPQTEKADAWRHHKDYALLFATNEYDYWPALENPIPDAHDLAQMLEEHYGFSTPEVVKNPTGEQIVAKLREYIEGRHFDESDQLFIFFAGHGYYDETFKQGYIVAKDSRLDDKSRRSYVSYNDLRNHIDTIHAKHVFLVLDACYSGTIDPRLEQAGSRGTDIYAENSLPELFQKKVGKTTRKYLTSGEKDYVSDGIPGHHSPFVKHLLDVLGHYGENPGFLTLANVIAAMQMSKPVPHASDWGQNDPASEFFFISTDLAARLNGGQPTTAGNVTPDIETRGAELGSTSRTRPAIAVLGFRNVGRRTDDAWVSTWLAELLTTELASSAELRTRPGESVAQAKLDLNLRDASGYGTGTLGKIYKALGADYVVSGSYNEPSQPRGGLQINVWLQNAKNGQPIAQFGASGTESDLSGLATRVAAQLRARLGISNPEPKEAAAAKTATPSVPEGARLYAMGLTKLRAYDLLGARATLERAVAVEPNFALAHLALARTLHELGYDHLAVQQAAFARDHSSGLPMPSAKAIEGAYFSLNGQWDDAIEIYNSLWVLSSETDDALVLANLQSSAGKGQDALTTLVKLRKASKQAAQDPRVDLEEAYAASTVSDFKLQHQAAQRAIKLAGEGSRLIAAQAYWRDCGALLELGDLANAETACSKANQISDFAGGHQIKARSLTVLASVMEKQGKIPEAIEDRKEALRIARDIGSKKDMIGALMNLANSQSPSEAKSGYQEAIANAREIDDKQQLATALLDLASALFAEGDYSGARENYEQCLKSANETGDKENAATALQNLGLLSFQSGKLVEAKDRLLQSIKVADSCEAPGTQAASLAMLGDLLLAQADIAGAQKTYDDALRLYADDQGGIASTRQSLAQLRLEEARPAEAETLARQVAEEFEKEKSADQEASARETLARSLMEQGKLADAMEEIDTASKLPVENRAIRLSLTVTGAKLSARSGKLDAARRSLKASLDEATRLQLAGKQLEIRLALAEFENSSDAGGAESQLRTLESDATRSGYLLLAGKAARLRQAKVAAYRK